MILAGDIGGTKSNLGLFDAQQAEKPARVAHKRYSSHENPGLKEIVQDFLRETKAQVTAASFGVAGPVVNNCVHGTEHAVDCRRSRSRGFPRPPTRAHPERPRGYRVWCSRAAPFGPRRQFTRASPVPGCHMRGDRRRHRARAKPSCFGTASSISGLWEQKADTPILPRTPSSKPTFGNFFGPVGKA